MNAQQQKILVIVVLLVAAAGILYWQLGSTGDDTATAGTQADQTGTTPPAADGSATAPASPTAPKPQYQQTKIDIDALLSSVKEITFDYEKEQLARNPMSPLVGKEAGPDIITRGGPQPPIAPPEQVRRFKVTGIVWNKSNPIAVIDNQVTNEVVSKGYTFREGAVVEDIQPDHVVLRVGDSSVTLTLKDVKEP
ncbi:MAG: hypothetical protein HY706_04960 [Candidatus Hydrogenedentes bacterium]|nr:hypothetical protein [Candidatus Hydrogenedentota bacterium]